MANITPSNIDYEKHISEVKNNYIAKYGEASAQKFIDFYDSRYRVLGRSFLNHRVCWSLFDDFKEVEKSGLRWYAFVGDGGTGKTTLGKNVFYFFDATFGMDRITFDAFGLVKVLHTFPRVKAMKAALLDEPDSSIHVNSKEGAKLRSILGKARQQALFLGYCATDMKDIPNYIYKKLSGVFFCPYLGEAMFFKNRPKKKIYIMQQLKQEYDKIGYKVFFKYQNSMGCVRFKTNANTALNPTQEIEYLNKKEKDYDEDLKEFLGMEEDHKDKGRMNPVDIIVVNNYKKGKTQKEIGEIIGVDQTQVSRILRKYDRYIKI
jgi:hypothetical protein